MKNYSKAVVLLAFGMCPALSQGASLDGIKLRAHSSDKNSIEKPALMQYTDSKEKDNSYLIDAALSYTKPPATPEDARWATTYTFESHKNTLVDKEQDVQSLGVSRTHRLGLDCDDNGLSCLNAFYSFYKLSYQLDNVKSEESVLAYTEFSGLNPRINLNGFSDGAVGWYWSPTAGIEYEDVIKSSTGARGSLYRLYGNFEFAVQPFKSFRGFSLSANYSAWRDYGKDSSLNIEDDNHELKKISINQILNDLDARVKVSLNLEWAKGENPRLKVIEQEYFLIGIGVSI